jgi:hypothetical protein
VIITTLCKELAVSNQLISLTSREYRLSVGKITTTFGFQSINFPNE